MRPSVLLVTAAIAVSAAAGASPAAGAALTGVLATDAADGSIAAYSTTAAWNRWDAAAGGYRLVVDRGGKIRTLGVAPSGVPFAVSAGRGPDGQTWLVWSRCSGGVDGPPGDCNIEGYDLGTNRPQAFPFAARPGVMERAPSIRDDHLVYVVGGSDGVGAVHLARTDGTDDRVIDVMPPTVCGLSLYRECFAVTQALAVSSALRSDRVAVSSRVGTAGGDFGICGLATVRLLDLKTSAVRTLDDAVCGMSGQTLTNLGFDTDGRLWWRMACGDQSACEGTGSGPFRQTSTAVQRLDNTLRSRLMGVAIAGRTPILASRAPRTETGCWTGPSQTAYVCGTVEAMGASSFTDLRPPREDVPPPGYLTVRGTSAMLVLEPPATMACSRGDVQPKPGATLWAGVSYTKGTNGVQRTHGPAVPVAATSKGRTVKGTVPKGASNFEGQVTTTLDLGGPSKACGRTWTLTYRPSNKKPISFRTRVLPR